MNVQRMEEREIYQVYSRTGASCSTARIACLFSATRAARRSRAAYMHGEIEGTRSKEIFMTNLVLDTASLHLVREDLGAGLLGLSLVDVLHEDTLVLEDVTLRLLVE